MVHLLDDIQQNYANEPVQVIADRHGVSPGWVARNATQLGLNKNERVTTERIWRDVKQHQCYANFQRCSERLYEHARRRGMLSEIRRYYREPSSRYRKYENGYVLILWLDGLTAGDIALKLNAVNRKLGGPRRTTTAIRCQKNRILKNMPELILR